MDFTKPYLKYYFKEHEGKISLDSVECSGQNPEPPKDGFIKWLERSDIEQIKLVPPDLDQLAKESDGYWAKRYAAVGLSFPPG